MKIESYPDYKNFIWGLPPLPQGQPRFFININTATYTAPHHHDYAELSYFLDGEGTEWIDGEQREISPGTASFILPYHTHGLRSCMDRPLRKYRIMFDLQVILNKEREANISRLLYQIGPSLPPWVQFNPEQNERMNGICEILNEEFSLPDSVEKQLMIQTKLTEALLLFIRTGRQNVQQGTKILSKSTTDSSTIIWPILQYLHSHYSEPITLESTAHMFNLSIPYVSRLFREAVGKGFVEYVHFLRIEGAATLLRHTNLSITDVAMEVGFESLRTFTRVFRKFKGMSASEFRNQPVDNLSAN